MSSTNTYSHACCCCCSSQIGVHAVRGVCALESSSFVLGSGADGAVRHRKRWQSGEVATTNHNIVLLLDGLSISYNDFLY